MSNIGGYDKQWARFRYMIWMPTTMIVGGLMWIPAAIAFDHPPFLSCAVFGVLYGFAWLALSKAFMPRTMLGSIILGAVSPLATLIATCVGTLVFWIVIYFWWSFLPGGILIGIGDILVRRLVGDVRPIATPQKPARWNCWSCNYDLYGLPVVDGAVRCPECGTVNKQIERSGGF